MYMHQIIGLLSKCLKNLKSILIKLMPLFVFIVFSALSLEYYYMELFQKSNFSYFSIFPTLFLVTSILASFAIAWVISYLTNIHLKSIETSKTTALINTILQSTFHLIISTDEQGIVTIFNRAAEQRLGYSAADIIGKTSPAMWHEEYEVINRAEVLSKELGIKITPGFDVFIAKAKLGIIEATDWTLVHKNGSRIPARLTVTTLQDNNKVIGYLGVLEDLSNRKKSEHEIRVLKNAIENAIEGIAKFDANGLCIDVNETYASMVGYEPKELIGKKWDIVVHPQDKVMMLEEYKKMRENGKVSAGALGIRKDGCVFHKQVTMVENIGETGTFAGHFCFMKDMTDRK
jgi:PAS domain S-box-containing protein